MKDYILYPAKPIVLYEIYLPARTDYKEHLTRVLDAFLSSETLLNIPKIKSLIEKWSIDRGCSKDDIIKELDSVISGYSIYEVNGRFASGNGPVDELTWAIRFIIHDPKWETKIRNEIIEQAKMFIKYLITERFAREIGIEDEIWFVEYQNCNMQRWIKV